MILNKAPRLVLRILRASARGAVLAIALLVGEAGAGWAQDWRSEQLVAAAYAEPTGRYPHGVLGDAIEFGALRLTYTAGVTVEIKLSENRVFEDVAPRIVDVDGDAKREVVVVESDQREGARLAIYDGDGLRAATPFIGTRFRWLAPIGAADMDGDGFIEIAYIDRPHLAKTLRIWRYRDGALEPVADQPGLTNHRIGEPDIGGGLRSCEKGVEMITASANWARVIASRLSDGQIVTQDIGPHTGRASLNAALDCQLL